MRWDPFCTTVLSFAGQPRANCLKGNYCVLLATYQADGSFQRLFCCSPLNACAAHSFIQQSFQKSENIVGLQRSSLQLHTVSKYKQDDSACCFQSFTRARLHLREIKLYERLTTLLPHAFVVCPSHLTHVSRRIAQCLQPDPSSWGAQIQFHKLHSWQIVHAGRVKGGYWVCVCVFTCTSADTAGGACCPRAFPQREENIQIHTICMSVFVRSCVRVCGLSFWRRPSVSHSP